MHERTMIGATSGFLRRARTSALGLVALGAFGSAHAFGPLNLTPAPPDIVSAFIDVSYDAATDTLIASGFASEIDDDGVGLPIGIIGGTFDIVATVDAVGDAFGGSLSIGGTVAGLGFNSGTLLTGVLSAFGGAGDTLEFLFDVTGGDAAGLFGPSAGVILNNATNSTPFDFSADFASNPFSGTSDTFGHVATVPEPGTLVLLVGALAFAARRRRG